MHDPHRDHGAWPTDSAVEQPARVKVGRRWMPWRSRSRSATRTAWDWVPEWGHIHADDPVSTTLSTIGFIVCLPLYIPAFLMSIVFLIESLAQWIAMPFAILLRMLGFSDVEIDARDGAGRIYRERVRGWGRAKARKQELKKEAARGIRPQVSSTLPPGFTPPAPPTGFTPRRHPTSPTPPAPPTGFTPRRHPTSPTPPAPPTGFRPGPRPIQPGSGFKTHP